MEKNEIKKGIAAILVLIGLLLVSGVCSASVTVSIDNVFKIDYYPGEVVHLTSIVNISNESACALYDPISTLNIYNGDSTVCYLPDASGLKNVSFCGDCTPLGWSCPPPCSGTETWVNIMQTNYLDCLKYGTNNTYTYKINWTIPSYWDAGNYTAEMEVYFNGTEYTDLTTFKVYMKGDLYRDCVIDLLDFVRFARSYGTSCGDPGYNPVSDFNDDCVIDLLDFVMFVRFTYEIRYNIC